MRNKNKSTKLFDSNVFELTVQLTIIIEIIKSNVHVQTFRCGTYLLYDDIPVKN